MAIYRSQIKNHPIIESSFLYFAWKYFVELRESQVFDISKCKTADTIIFRIVQKISFAMDLFCDQ